MGFLKMAHITETASTSNSVTTTKPSQQRRDFISSSSSSPSSSSSSSSSSPSSNSSRQKSSNSTSLLLFRAFGILIFYIYCSESLPKASACMASPRETLEEFVHPEQSDCVAFISVPTCKGHCSSSTVHRMKGNAFIPEKQCQCCVPIASHRKKLEDVFFFCSNNMGFEDTIWYMHITRCGCSNCQTTL